MQQKLQNIHETIATLLPERLKKFSGQSLTKEVCIRIYQEIFLATQEIIVEIPQICQNITHDCVNYIAQAYYDLVYINDTEELDPNIFDKRPTPTELSNQDLIYAAMFLKGTNILPEIVATLKKRS